MKKRVKCRVCKKVKNVGKFDLPVNGERATIDMCLKCYKAIKNATIIERRKILPVAQDYS